MVSPPPAGAVPCSLGVTEPVSFVSRFHWMSVTFHAIDRADPSTNGVSIFLSFLPFLNHVIPFLRCLPNNTALHSPCLLASCRAHPPHSTPSTMPPFLPIRPPASCPVKQSLVYSRPGVTGAPSERSGHRTASTPPLWASAEGSPRTRPTRRAAGERRREGKGREGKRREGKGREEKRREENSSAEKLRDARADSREE